MPLSAPPAPTLSGPERYVIPNLRNACRILQELGLHAEGLKAAELARRLRVPVTTTLRIMSTLLLEGYVRKVDGRFKLGPVLIRLGQAALAATEIRELALPVLRDLTAATDETSHLAIPSGDQSLIVAVQDSPHPLGAASRPGFLADLHCSSTGKVFLAHVHAHRLEALYGKKPPAARTPRTLTTLAALAREAATTRERGYGLDNEEFYPGVRCLAAPVHAPDGSVIAAIGITAATSRFTLARVPAVVAAVTKRAAELTRLLGGSPRAA